MTLAPTQTGAVDEMLRTYTFGDPVMERFRHDALRNPFPAAALLGMTDLFLARLRERIRGGATFDEVKWLLGEDQAHERPGQTDPAAELAKGGADD